MHLLKTGCGESLFYKRVELLKIPLTLQRAVIYLG